MRTGNKEEQGCVVDGGQATRPYVRRRQAQKLLLGTRSCHGRMTGVARLGCERGRTKRQCNGQDQKTRAPQTMGPRSSPREHHHGVIFVVNHASTLLHEAVSGLLGYAAKDGSGVTASVTTIMAQPLQ